MAPLFRLILILPALFAVTVTTLGCGRACGSVYVPSEVTGSIYVASPVTALDRATFTICKNGQCATSVLEVAQSGSVATAECVQPANNPITCDVATSRDGAVVSVHYGLNTTTTDVGDVYTFTIQQPGVTSPVLSTTRIPQYTTSEPNGDGCGKVTTGTI